MAKMTVEQITEILTARKAEGLIWNVEFVDMKDRLGRLIWDADSANREPLRNAEKAIEAAGLKTTFCYLSNSHDLLATTKKLKAAFARMDDQTALDAFLTFWQPFISASELLVSLKPLVQKGRKPNPEAEAARERSLENTGTCGCCNRNIKLTTAELIWDHGFAIVNRGYGYGAGYKTGKSCFGVNYQPIEVSKAVWVDMLAAWTKRVADLPQVIDRLKARLNDMALPVRKMDWQMTKEEEDYAKVYQGVQQSLRDCKSELSHLKTFAIPEITEKIAKWAPRPLPGQGRK